MLRGDGVGFSQTGRPMRLMKGVVNLIAVIDQCVGESLFILYYDNVCSLM